MTDNEYFFRRGMALGVLLTSAVIGFILLIRERAEPRVLFIGLAHVTLCIAYARHLYVEMMEKQDDR